MSPFRPIATLAFGLGSLLFACGLPAGSVSPVAAVAAPAGPAPLVMLDPGHGGRDQGVSIGSVHEAELALDLARRAAVALQAAGYRVVMTRDSGGSAVAERVLEANRQHPACLVSLHFNQSPSAASKGWRVFVPAVSAGAQTVQAGAGEAMTVLPWGQAQALATPRSRQLGEAIASALEGGSSRGVQALRLELFRGLVCPAVVVEAGFLTQPDELDRLKAEAGRQDLAQRIARGIEAYLKARGDKP